VREIKEETGLDVHDIELVLFQEFIYDDAFWKRRHFIFFDYACKSDSKEVRLNSEAQKFVWVSPDDALNLLMDAFTKRTIERYLSSAS